jgi:hypothetical protein
VRSVSPVRSIAPAAWLMVFIVAVSTLALFEVAISVQLLTGQKVARTCQAAQLRASVASDDGFSGEEDAMVQLTNLSPRVCTLQGFPYLTAETLAHRTFVLGVGHFYGPNETVGPYVFPAPRALACTTVVPPISTSTGWTRTPSHRAPPPSLPAWTTTTSGSGCRANGVR